MITGKPLDGKYIAKDGSVTSSEEDANKYVTGKSSKAPYYCGLSTRLTYKNWDLGSTVMEVSVLMSTTM